MSDSLSLHFNQPHRSTLPKGCHFRSVKIALQRQCHTRPKPTTTAHRNWGNLLLNWSLKQAQRMHCADIVFRAAITERDIWIFFSNSFAFVEISSSHRWIATSARNHSNRFSFCRSPHPSWTLSAARMWVSLNVIYCETNETNGATNQRIIQSFFFGSVDDWWLSVAFRHIARDILTVEIATDDWRANKTLFLTKKLFF